MIETTPGASWPHLDDAQLVAVSGCAEAGCSDPEYQHQLGGGRPDDDPQRLDQRVTDEDYAGDDLVRECQRQRQVQVQVNDPPGLVPQPPPEPRR